MRVQLLIVVLHSHIHVLTKYCYVQIHLCIDQSLQGSNSLSLSHTSNIHEKKEVRKAADGIKQKKNIQEQLKAITVSTQAYMICTPCKETSPNSLLVFHPVIDNTPVS